MAGYIGYYMTFGLIDKDRVCYVGIWIIRASSFYWRGIETDGEKYHSHEVKLQRTIRLSDNGRKFLPSLCQLWSASHHGPTSGARCHEFWAKLTKAPSPACVSWRARNVTAGWLRVRGASTHFPWYARPQRSPPWQLLGNRSEWRKWTSSIHAALRRSGSAILEFLWGLCYAYGAAVWKERCK